MVSVQCAVCTGMSVLIFVTNAECLWFFFPPLMYRLEVCLVSLYMLRLCVGVRMKTERQLYRLGRSLAPPQVSKQMNV